MATKGNKTDVELPDALNGYVPQSWEDFQEKLDSVGLEFITVAGSPYEVVKKDVLIGVPFAIVDVREYEGKFGPAVAVCVITQDDRKLVFNDGSTGVMAQLKEIVAQTGRHGGFLCPNGLRASEFEYQPTDFDGEPMGNPIPATTYYIA